MPKSKNNGGFIMAKHFSEIESITTYGMFRKGYPIDQIVKKLEEEFGVTRTPSGTFNRCGYIQHQINEFLAGNKLRMHSRVAYLSYLHHHLGYSWRQIDIMLGNPPIPELPIGQQAIESIGKLT